MKVKSSKRGFVTNVDPRHKRPIDLKNCNDKEWPSGEDHILNETILTMTDLGASALRIQDSYQWGRFCSVCNTLKIF